MKELTTEQLKFVAFDAFSDRDQDPMAQEAIDLLYSKKTKTYKYFRVEKKLKPHAQVVKEAIKEYACKECFDKGFVSDPFWEWPIQGRNTPCPNCKEVK